MKKAGVVLSLVLVATTAFSQVSKEEILKKVVDKYQAVSDVKVDVEISNLMLAGTMKISGTIWKKGEKIRANMLTQLPGMPAPMEEIMVSEGEAMMVYEKTSNMVMKFDFSKMPAEFQVTKNQTFCPMDQLAKSDIAALGEKAELKEAMQQGKKFYVLEIKDLPPALGPNTPLVPGQSSQSFKRMKIWVDPGTDYVSRLEFFREAEQPDMWMNFKNYSTGSIPASVFSLDIPKDAQIMDMSEMMGNIMKGMVNSIKPSTN